MSSKNKNFGRIRWFNSDFGYGFIRIANGNDVFVHWSDVQYTSQDATKRLKLSKGQAVSFTCLKDNGTHLRAKEVVKCA